MRTNRRPGRSDARRLQTRLLLALAIVLQSATVALPSIVLGAPANDNIAGATVIADPTSYLDAGVVASTATTEAGEAVPTCEGSPSKTVWYRFTAATATTIGLSVTPTTIVGNDMYPFMAVYTGSPGSLTQVDCAYAYRNSSIYRALPIAAGTTYYIQVGDRYSGAVIGFDFRSQAHIPAHDFFDFRKTIASPIGYTDLGVVATRATTQTNEPTPTCDSTPGKTVWYQFTAPESTTLAFRVVPTTLTGNDPWPLLGLYTGSWGSFTQVDCATAWSNRPLYRAIPVVEGQTYYLQVGDQYSDAGALGFDVRIERHVPSHDFFDFRKAIASPIGYADLGVVATLATTQANEPTPTCDSTPGKTVWYQFTAPETTTLAFRVVPTTITGNDPWPLLALYTGSWGSFTQVDCAEAWSNRPLYRAIPVVEGQTYYLQVGDQYSDAGALGFDVRIERHVPSHDFFDFRKTITSPLAYQDSVVATLATTQANEPSPTCESTPAKTVWYEYTPEIDTQLSLTVTPTSLVDNDATPFIAVYRGSGPGSFTELGCFYAAGWYPTNLAVTGSLAVTGGQTYHIQVGERYDGAVIGYVVTARDSDTPTVSVPGVSLLAGKTLGTTTTLATLRYVGSAPLGLAGFEVQRTVNGGAWTAVETTMSSPRSYVTSSGVRYQYRVRTLDGAGNHSVWAYSRVFVPVVYEESSSAIRYGGTWSRATGTAFHGGALRYATAAGASGTFTFTGRNVSWVTSKGPNRGKARIYIGSTLVKTVDLYASSATYRSQVWSYAWSTSATRTIKVVVVGTSGRPRVDLDTMVVLR